VLFESFGIDLDDHIIAESDLNGCSNTGFADQRVAFSVLLPVKQEEFQPFSPDLNPCRCRGNFMAESQNRYKNPTL
jgi:hypothetical protein